MFGPSALLLLSSALVAHAVPPECARWSPPDLGPSVSQDSSCLASPPIGTFNPVVEWTWEGSSILPQYHRVMMTPVVGNINDDNGDGLVDSRDIPDIVFTSYVGIEGYQTEGAIIAISGDGSGDHWAIEAPGGHPVGGAAGVAIGDIDNDGRPDICVGGARNYNTSLICLNGDGSFKFAAGSTPYTYGGPAFADMDHDGHTEIIFGNQIYDYQGNQIGQGDYGDGRNFLSVPVDWDNDGVLEVVAGNAVYEMDGSVQSFVGIPGDPLTDGDPSTSRYNGDAIPAIVDLDLDGYPDMVKVTWGEVVAIDNTGVELWRHQVPGGGNGGPPTIADFDGDGFPDIGVAGKGAYGVFRHDGTLLWQNDVVDISSSVTGSSVFDFEGDGIAEVVYADEQTLWVFSGPTGEILIADDTHSSATLYEYPVIADVDHDKNTEIIVANNRYGGSNQQTGIVVIGDRDNSWYPARPIWNQHAYHITNINNDGSIPTRQTDNWLTWNNFRAGGTELGPSNWLAQLSAGEPQSCLGVCNPKVVEFYIPLENSGLLDASNIGLAFYRDDGSTQTLVYTLTYPYLAGGTSEIVGPIEFNESQWGPDELILKVDYQNTSSECDESDNERSLGYWPYPTLDEDGDGYESSECGGPDCNDKSPDISPAVDDIPGNGIDEDCDGDDDARNDCDLDEDGFVALDCGGDDCDDADPEVNPEATDIPGNGVDEDCDGQDAIQIEAADLNQKCGCAAGLNTSSPLSGNPGLLLALLGLIGVIRKRR